MTAYKMVPTVATAEMVEADIDSAQATTKAAMLGHKIPFVEGLQRCYSVMLAVVTPFVVSDAMAGAAWYAYLNSPCLESVGAMRAAIEAALEAAAKGDV